MPPSPAPRIIWMFSGQGSQYARMGRALHAANADFRAALEECDELCGPLLDRSLLGLLLAEPPDPAVWELTRYSHPAILALQYALARTLLKAGAQPHALLGYSLGELVAAVVGGALSLEAGLAAAVEHASICQRTSEPGAMLAVMDSPHVLLRWPDALDDCWIGAVNAPRHFVVSGRRAAVVALHARLDAAGIPASLLPVATGFHSPLIDPAMPDLLAGAKSRALDPLRRPVYSARGLGPFDRLDPEFFARAGRAAMDFPATLRRTEADGPCLYIDLGPSGTLANFVKYSDVLRPESRFLEIMSPFGRDARNLGVALNAMLALTPLRPAPR